MHSITLRPFRRQHLPSMAHDLFASRNPTPEILSSFQGARIKLTLLEKDSFSILGKLRMPRIWGLENTFVIQDL